MYSSDNGKNWNYIVDGLATDAVPASKVGYYNTLYPLQTALVSEALTTPVKNKTFNWDISALTSGNYILRIEAYRENQGNGYGYHDVFITVKK